MRSLFPFLAGLAAGVLLTVAFSAHADWNGSSGGFNADTRILERLARAAEESADELGEIARHQSDTARHQSETARAVQELGRSCR